MCENCRNNCDCHKEVNLNDFTKEYLWEQLEAVEDERNRLLNVVQSIYDYLDNKPMLTGEEENYIDLLESVGCR